MCNNIMHEKHIKSPFIQNRGNKKETLFIFLLHSHTNTLCTQKTFDIPSTQAAAAPQSKKHTKKKENCFNIYFYPPYPTCCLQHRPHHTKSCRNNNTIKIWYYKINVWENAPHLRYDTRHTHTLYYYYKNMKGDNIIIK